jgi:hypothetical protein
MSHTRGRRVLRRIFGPNMEEVGRDWRKLHNEEPRNLYSSPSIIRVIKQRRVRGGVCSTHGILEKWSENLKGRDHSEDLGDGE